MIAVQAHQCGVAHQRQRGLWRFALGGRKDRVHERNGHNSGTDQCKRLSASGSSAGAVKLGGSHVEPGEIG